MKRVQTVLALGGILAMVLFLLVAWQAMPPTIPIHFGADGRANGYGGRIWLWFPVAMATILYGVLSAVERAPHLYNLPLPPGDSRRGPYEELAAGMIGWLQVTLVWMFFFIAMLEVRGAQGHGGPVVLWLLPAVLGVSFLPIAWFFWKARSLRT